MAIYSEERPMRAFSLCRSRLQALQKRIDRWHAVTFYSSLSFMALILVVTLPHRIF
jgi:hypothetical protein